MQSITKRLVPLVIFFCGALLLNVPRGNAQRAPRDRTPVYGTRLFTGADGETHAEKFDVYSMPNLAKEANIRFLRIKAGTVEDYHHAPQRQYLVTISGHAVIGVANGEKVTQDPGGLLLTEDLTGKGHTAVIGPNEDLVIMEVALPDKDPAQGK